MTNRINLKRQQLFWLESDKSLQSGTIIEGKAWVTMSGCQKDFIVSAGEKLPTTDQAILIEALSESLQIELADQNF